jgi:hypothetical protein
MDYLPTQMDVVLVSAGAALIIGGAVRVFGSKWLFTGLRHIAGFVMRRRGVSTAILGAAASTGLAAASVLGIQPLEMGDAVSWFQSQFSDVSQAMDLIEAVSD